MTSSSQERPEPRPAAADVFDRIPVDRIEPLLHRAIELEAVSGPDDGTIDRRSLEEIARELRIDPRNLRRAIAEDRVRPLVAEPDVWDRIFGSDHIVVSRTVAGSAEQVRADVEGWLARREGMRLRVRTAEAEVWERDDSLVSKLRMKLTRGPGALRTAKRVSVRMYPVDHDEQLVTLEADAGPLQRLGRWLLGGVAAVTGIALVGGVAATGSLVGGLGALAGLVLAVPVIAGVRLATERLQDGAETAMDGIANAATSGARATDADRLLAMAGSWADALRSIFGRTPRP